MIVRRKFDWKNQYIGRCVNIISMPLRTALRHIMRDVKGISLDEESPSVDPNVIFLFLEEIHAYIKRLREQDNFEEKIEKAKEIALQIRHLKVLVKFLNEDYEEIKKSLVPLLKSKEITFELLWALFKSNEIVYTPTYNTKNEPRAFKIEYVNLVSANIYRSFRSLT